MPLARQGQDWGWNLDVNYLTEIKAFYDRLELNPQPNTAIALWHALMHIANKAGWPDTFTAASSILMLKSGLNASAFKRARNKLSMDGLIEWKSRGGSQSAQYRLISLAVQKQCKFEPQSEPQFEPQCEPQNEPQSEPQCGPINKHRQNINKTKTETPPIPPAGQTEGFGVDGFDDFWLVYPKHGNRYLAETEFCNAALSGVSGSDLAKAAGRYAERCRKERVPERFIKNPENFLRDNVFVEYLEGGKDGKSGGDTGAAEKSANELMQERGPGMGFGGF